MLTGQAPPPRDLSRMVDINTGLVDRRIFADQDIYELELERIFARAWNFMAHDTQLPNPGDFFMTFIGEDRVIVVRDNDGSPQVLVNSCRHRGNAVCRAEEGHASSFMCTYHGWTYDLKGDLVGVPGFKEVYHEELAREGWGLIKAAQVDSYKGFIFANMDAEAPRLGEYLGDVGRVCIDLLAARGDIQIRGGIQKYKIPCNWKFAAETSSDMYHTSLSHASAFMSGFSLPGGRWTGDLYGESLVTPNMVMLGEYGHTLSGPTISAERETGQAKMATPATPGRKRKSIESWRTTPEARAALGAAINSRGGPSIFPNFTLGALQAGLRLPRGPHETELWVFSFLDKELSRKSNEAIRQKSISTFGPAGLLEQDDGDNWNEATRGSRGVVTRRYPFNLAMGLGHGEIIEEEGEAARIETQVNEHAQLWLYRCWSEWMAAASWPELKANHSPTPSGRV